MNANCHGLQAGLERQGYNITTTEEPGADDEAVQMLANRDGLVLVTSDRDWHSLEMKKMIKTAVIIVQDVPDKLALVLHTLEKHETQLLNNESFTVRKTATGRIQVRSIRTPRPTPTRHSQRTAHAGAKNKARRNDKNTPNR